MQGQLHLLYKQPLASPGNNIYVYIFRYKITYKYIDILDISTSVTLNEIKLLRKFLCLRKKSCKTQTIMRLPKCQEHVGVIPESSEARLSQFDVFPMS